MNHNEEQAAEVSAAAAEVVGISNRFLLGQLVCLTAPHSEADAEVVARWSRDTEYHRLADNDPAYPLSGRQAKEWLERCSPSKFDFMIRALRDDRLIGGIGLWIENWAHGEAWMGIGIGDRAYWGNGYGTEALRLLLQFAFDELNLRRVSLGVFTYNPRAIRSYEKVGFRREGLVRGECRRNGQRWDTVFMGILHEE